MQSEGKERISGTVEDVVYRNDANGYTILQVLSDTTKEIVTAVGTFPFVGEGEAVTVSGEWVFHSEYGKQFRVDEFEKKLPEDANSILKYLSSGAIKGLGPKTAAKIVDKYGADTFDILSNHPDWISEFKGITVRRALEISDEIKKQTGFYKLFDFCREYCSMNVALRIYNAYGDNAIGIIRANPYKLCSEIDGYNFETADSIAVACGYAHDGRDRILGATIQTLKSAASQGGHSCLPVKVLIEQVAELIGVDKTIVAEQEKAFAASKEIGYLHRKENSLLYLNEYLSIENRISGRLKLLNSSCIRYDFSDMEPLVNRVEFESGIEFAALQRKAIFEAASGGILIVTGGPGTGKTTIIKTLIKIYESMGCDVALAAPTGRAAMRMSESTSHAAKTIHRLLEVEYRDDDGGGSVFGRNEHNLLDEDIVIIDEASMLDMFLTDALLAAIRPGARVVFLGDCDQLPSVGAGNILHDMINSGIFNTVRLTEVFRQENESLIITNAHKINRGEMPVTDAHDKDFFFMRRDNADELLNTVVDVCANRLPKSYGVSAFDKIQIITPTRKGGSGTESLNRLLQQRLNPPSPSKKEKKFRETVFREGDKVMQIRNNYDLCWSENGAEKSGIYNGDIGVIKKMYEHQDYMMIDFDGREVKYDFKLLEDIEHAYAITVHKSQGSEYPYVIMPVADFPPMLMTRNLLYTAVTRARKMVVLIGREDAIRRMVDNDREAVRYTGLEDLLEAN